MKKVCLSLLAVVVLLCGCNGTDGRTLSSATGTIYECLVVMPDRPLSATSLEAIAQAGLVRPTGSAYDEAVSTTYDEVRQVMAAPMPGLPAVEPYFKLTQVPMGSFDNFLKPTRNILIVDINPERYTAVKAKVSTDLWSHPQAVYRIQAPNDEDFTAYWLAHGEQVREWFVKQEMQRQMAFLRAGTNADARARLKKEMGCDMLIPEDYMLLMDTLLHGVGQHDVRLLWCCNNKGSMRKDLVVYAYPYTDAAAFTPEVIRQQRDAVLGRVVTAQVEGSHMGTEYRVLPPESRQVGPLQGKKDGFYAVETRGLWKILDGEAMGGPYVSLTRLDCVGAQVVTAEVFLFASGQKKRNALRQMETMLYSLQLPEEMTK